MELPRITEVLAIDGIPYKAGGASADIDCPLCGGKKKLSVHLQRDVARCNKCGWGGGVLALHAVLMGLDPTDTKAAFRDLREKMGGEEGMKARARAPKAVPAAVDPTAPRERRDAVNRALVGALALEPDHMENLKGRGLDEAFIRGRGYRSYPSDADGLREAARKVMAAGQSPANVPGFMKDEAGNMQLRPMPRGFLIPVRSLHGDVEGFQIRVDKDRLRKKTHKDGDGNLILGEDGKPALFEEGKYICLSSPDLDGGGKMRSVAHYAGPYRRLPDGTIAPDVRGAAIKYTEGPLKADIWWRLTGEPCVAVLGVNNVRALEATLRELKELCPQVTEAQCCLDMDDAVNPFVEKAVRQAEDMVCGLGLGYRRMRWDPRYKGLDDFAAERARRKTARA